MDLDPNNLKALDAAAPGIGGALTAAIFTKGTFWVRAGFFIVGAIAARYASDLALKIGEVSASTAAYLVGALSPAIINKLLRTWEGFDLGATLKRFLSRWLPSKGEDK